MTINSWTAEEFLAREIPPSEPLVEGLLNRRDLVALGARRRHGKTTFCLNLAVNLATGADEFLGYRIPSPRRTLLLLLDTDSPPEVQDALRQIIGSRDVGARIRLLHREDFYDADRAINIMDFRFRDTIAGVARAHHPDLIVLDNLSQLMGGDYNDATKINVLAAFAYRLAREQNAAVLIPAHPRKEDQRNPVSLADDPEVFFESIMEFAFYQLDRLALGPPAQPRR